MNLAFKSPEDIGDQTRADIDGAEVWHTANVNKTPQWAHSEPQDPCPVCTTPTTPAHLVLRAALPGGQQAAPVWVAVQHLLFLFLLPDCREGLNPFYCLCCFGRPHFKQFLPFWLLLCTPLPEEFWKKKKTKNRGPNLCIKLFSFHVAPG